MGKKTGEGMTELMRQLKENSKAPQSNSVGDEELIVTSLRIPKDLYRELKLIATTRDITIKALITDLIKVEVEKAKGKGEV